MTIEKQLASLEQQRAVLLAKQEAKRSNQMFKCSCCDKFHKIKNLTVIQTHWYEGPHGCMGGDMWHTGEMQVICPTTGVRNRLLYHSTYQVDWRLRSHYAHNAEMQFNRMYKHLFKEVVDEHKEKTQNRWVNNYYVDENHKKFSIDVGVNLKS